MRNMTLFLILIAVFLMACSKEQNLFSTQMQTIIDLDDLEKTTVPTDVPLRVIYNNKWYESNPDLKDHFIPSIKEIKEGPDSTLYVFDYKNSRLVHLSLDGKYIRHIGGPGSGPGEFMQPNPYWERSSRYLYIPDTFGKRLQIFNLYGDYLRTITNIDMENGRLTVGRNGVLLVTPPFQSVPPVPYMIQMHDSLGSNMGYIGAIAENDNQVLVHKIRTSYIIIANEKVDHIWCVFVMSPLIRKYDYEGRCVEEIVFKSDKIKAYIKEGNEFMQKYKNPNRIKEVSGPVVLEHVSLSANGELLIKLARHPNLIISTVQGKSYVKRSYKVKLASADSAAAIDVNKIRLISLNNEIFGLFENKVILKSEPTQP